MDRVRGKKALVTGGASGIGRAIARMLAQEGAFVAVADIDGPGAQEAVADIAAQTGGDLVAVELDVTDENAWPAALGEAADAMQGLNVLVNNAGVCLPGTVEELTTDDWTRTIDVDLNSVFYGCRAALDIMRQHAPGSIINISSISGLIAGHNLAAYNAAKAGVWLLTKSIALHCAKRGYDVRANSIHPTFIDTAMIDEVVQLPDPKEAREKLARQVPLGRIGTPEDVAYAALYLASDESSFMTAAEIKLDGGISAM